jgi:hypothetical protein
MARVRRSWFVSLLVVATLVGCGGASGPPARGVLESNVEGWRFRRYQRLLDVEIWVADNPGVAHTASYARGAAEKRGRLAAGDVVSAVVTRYQRGLGVDRALIEFARKLARDATYRVEERVVGEVRLLLVSGGGEAWALWPAARHVVKLGGPGVVDVPEDLIAAYGERYPSRLEPDALERPLPPGPEASPPAPAAPFDPDHPEPTWQDGKSGT